MRSGIEILRSRRSLAVVAGMKKTNNHTEPTKKRYLHVQAFLSKHVVGFIVLSDIADNKILNSNLIAEYVGLLQHNKVGFL